VARAETAEIGLVEILDLNDWKRGRLLLRKGASARALLRDLRPASLRGSYSSRFPAKGQPRVLPPRAVVNIVKRFEGRHKSMDGPEGYILDAESFHDHARAGLL